MNALLKNILRQAGIYYPLQAFYRDLLFKQTRRQHRKTYEAYKGGGFTCNVCGEKYQKFVPDLPAPENSAALTKHNVIAGYGENIYCPNCLSTARERLVIAKLSSIDLRDKKVLHLSPEKNIYELLKKTAEVVTADLLPGFYRTVDGLVKKEDATKLSFAEKTFDMVIANHVLEHIPEDRKAMAEIFRVLKYGGDAILQVPYSTTLPQTIEEPQLVNPGRQSLLFGQKDHVRIYALDNYVERLRGVGFEVNILSYDDLQQFHEYAIQKDECFLDIRKPAKA